jgi:chromosome segregation ATPase
LHQGLDAAHAQRKPRSDSGLVRRDLEQYEAELNDLERELRREREALTEEVRQVQARTTEVEEIARATEVAMSQERAKLAREQTDLNRLRDEIRLEQDRKQRHVSLRNRLASLQP